MPVLTIVCLVALVSAYFVQNAAGSYNISALILIGIAYLTGGIFALRNAVSELLRFRVNVDLLMIAAVLGAALLGDYVEGGVLLFLFSLSGTMEQLILGRTRSAIKKLMKFWPDQARRIVDGKEELVPVEVLVEGDVLEVRPGERIATDGQILSGTSHLDQSAVTGESVPIAKSIGDTVISGCLNREGSFRFRVTVPASQSTLAKIIRLVEEAQSTKAESEIISKWFGEKYTLAVFGGAILAFFIFSQYFGHTSNESFYRAIMLLVVASPCAVVMSVPAVILAGIAGAARSGVLFKGGSYLEKIGGVKAIALDKTGTLTRGEITVAALKTFNGATEAELLSFAGSAEKLSEHPLSQSIVAAAKKAGVPLYVVGNFKAVFGKGLIADVQSTNVVIGKRELIEQFAIALPADLDEQLAELRTMGMTCVYVAKTGVLIGVIGLADVLRDEAAAAIADLKTLGLKEIVILTGDAEHVASIVGGKLGIKAKANLLPEQKLALIKEMKERYGIVAMVGDGVNDAPSLAAATLGISMGGNSTAVALETADIVLLSNDLRMISGAIRLGRKAKRVILQNFIIAFGVMIVLLINALFENLRLPFAVAGHEGSTVLVILNGLRLLGGAKVK
jgi:Cd2+/Zn2+-exporting ATPase